MLWKVDIFCLLSLNSKRHHCLINGNKISYAWCYQLLRRHSSLVFINNSCDRQLTFSDHYLSLPTFLKLLYRIDLETSRNWSFFPLNMKHEESSVIEPAKLLHDRVKLKQQNAIAGFKININTYLNMNNYFTCSYMYIYMITMQLQFSCIKITAPESCVQDNRSPWNLYTPTFKNMVT